MDQLTRTVRLQMIAFAVIAIAAITAVGIGYIGLPNMLFGIGHYSVTLQLPQSGNLYPTANVSYRGTEVGRVQSVRLTPTGVEATLVLESGIAIPSDLDAEVHSQTAVGEQYVDLLPRDGKAAPLREGSVIPVSRTSVPPSLNALLDATNQGLQAIPNNSVKTVVDESYTAVGGLGPEFSRFVEGSTRLAIDAKKNIGDLTSLIDGAPAILDSQADTAGEIQAWSQHLATVTGQLQTENTAVSGLLESGGRAADQARQLVDRVKPTLPILLMNLTSIGKVAVTYQNDVEQLLVLLPQGVAEIQGTAVANLNTKQRYKGFYLSFNTTNINLPPPLHDRLPASLPAAFAGCRRSSRPTGR